RAFGWWRAPGPPGGGPRGWVAPPLVVAPPAALYALLVAPQLATVVPAVLRPTLTGVAALLGTPNGATLAWAHFLAFDLFVGRWAYLDSRERGVSAWLMAPVLCLILMLGPVGFLLHLLTRALLPVRRPYAARVPAASQAS